MRRCVYCGSGLGSAGTVLEEVRAIGHLFADEGIGLVYGGARVGLMGVLADAVLAGGGEVIGVIPRGLVQREIAHPGLTDLRVVENMHERKATMAELADGFVALPGGTGTMEELFEAWTWGQLGLHVKPCGLVNIAGYYDALLTFIDRAMAAGFLSPSHRAMLVVESDAQALLRRFATYSPPQKKWSVSPNSPLSSVPQDGAAPVVEALVWVRVQGGRILVVRSRDKDMFYIPGGKRHPRESDFAALAREIKEELSVRLVPETLSLVTVVSSRTRIPCGDHPSADLLLRRSHRRSDARLGDRGSGVVKLDRARALRSGRSARAGCHPHARMDPLGIPAGMRLTCDRLTDPLMANFLSQGGRIKCDRPGLPRRCWALL